MTGLVLFALWAGVVYAVLSDVLAGRLEHRGPRARGPARPFPLPFPRVQGHDPEVEVGRPAAPGAAPPGRPMRSDPCTGRDWRDFWQSPG